MPTDDQLADQIREGLQRTLPVLHPPADLLDRVLERERSSLGANRTRQRRRLLVLTDAASPRIAVALSTLIALAIAIIAVTTLTHGGAPTTTANHPAGSSRQALIQTLGVLRTPQTGADIAALRSASLSGFLRPIATGACRPRGAPPMLRQARSIAGPNRAHSRPGLSGRLLPVQLTADELFPGRRRGDDDHIARAEIRLTGGGPASVGELRFDGLVLSANVGDGTNRGVAIVPDGVGKVTIGAFRLLDQPARQGEDHRQQELAGPRQRRPVPAQLPHGGEPAPRLGRSRAVLLDERRARLQSELRNLRASGIGPG